MIYKNIQFYKHNDFVAIVIPTGKTMIEDGVEISAPNWTTSIPLTDTDALSEYLTSEQIKSLE